MSKPPTEAAADRLADGERALAEGAWEKAAKAFRAALEHEESPEAWEGLGWAGWWLADEATTFDAREAAYRRFRADRRPAEAARVACWLAGDFREYRGEEATARGWLQRAASLLDGLPEVPEHGWIALMQADFALNFDRDSELALPLCEEAVRIGRELGVSDLEAVGLAQGGSCQVMEGRVEDGMRSLDEAVAIASAENLHLPVTQGWAFCCLISACDGVGDFQRAAEWCEATRRFTERWGGRQILGICRSSYGRVLATQGDWPAAEVELTGAVEDLQRSRPGMAAGGLARLGELRFRQGRVEEARELFERAGSPGLIGLGAIELESGSPEVAAAAADRALRRLPERSVLDRLPALELLARAQIAAGSLEPAADSLEQIRESAALIDTPYIRARARLLEAELDIAAERWEAARRGAEDAVDAFEESAAPFDAARGRVELARALAALGWQEVAERERSRARETFERLGAQRFAERAEQPLPGPQRGSGSDGAAELSALTPRELEVLKLIARGHSNGQIAEELVISTHTVHRHVANIRTKLALPSRAAAVAYATRAGLI